ncbi:alkaline phosphatase D family protein [Aurantiacibacter odishensis]|uniref:alkaline phosphatase D family protein n=1 Tax=Aurantiacibacter odishensis TaxID=1155476 RepID=UPI000E769B51|nr:alkaline phosphatase D family protein [Aurantiacibacter odishensis]
METTRRTLLRGFGAAAVTAFGFLPAARVLAAPVFRDYPFQLGVAAGDPAPDGFVIWTRLATQPLEIDYGMPAAAIEVNWEVAADERFRDVVQTGTALARPELGHSVHVEVAGLQPNRPYWYRFTSGRERSLWGRAMTLPAPGQPLDRVRFGIAGCQHYEQGYYTAHRHLAAEEPDFVFCYGDYLYEGRSNRVWNGGEMGPLENVRQYEGDELYTLGDYRRRYAQTKMDTDLQAAHAAAPWFMTWDDHEIDNNWVGDIDQDGTPPAIFALRKQSAMQAYYENMPLRASSMPAGTRMQLYRQARYGDLLDLNLLDTRQYRSDQPCNDRWGVPCEAIDRRDAAVLGGTQEEWLMGRLRASNARWQVLAQQIMMMDLDRTPGEPRTENLDSWAGYREPRRRVLEAVREQSRGNVVVLTGDEHQNYAGELHIDGKAPGPRPIATEFVSTSITSGGNGIDQRGDTVAIQQENPQLKWHNAQRGYVMCEVTPDLWTTQFRTIDTVTDRGGEMRTRMTMTVENGRPESLTEA